MSDTRPGCVAANEIIWICWPLWWMPILVPLQIPQNIWPLFSSSQEIDRPTPFVGASAVVWHSLYEKLHRSLLTPTAVAWVEFSAIFVCLLFFFARYLKNRCSLDHQTWNRNVQRWVPEKNIYFAVKMSNERSQQVCVGLQTERNIDTGCVRKPRWVFPAAIPHRTRHAS